MNTVIGPGFTLILCILGMFIIAPSVHAEGGAVPAAEPLVADAADPAARGLAIFREIDRRHNQNYADFSVALTMRLMRSAQAKPVVRQLRITQLEQDSGDRVMVVFDAPAAIRGTALLTHAHLQRDDDQWLFLPAFQRVKKITTSNKSGAFVQSEFAYEDLSVPILSKYSYRYLDQQPCGQQQCYLVERRAAGFSSGYGKELYWVDQTAYRIHRVEYFDARERPLKTLTLDDYRAYSPLLWKPHQMLMTNLRSGRKTELLWGDFQFAQGLQAERDFSVAALRRRR